MHCPFCGSSQLTVSNSRPTRGGTQIWRRRKCLKCGGIFTTYERMTLSHLIIVKKSGRKQKYNRAKLYSGIYHSSIDKKNLDRGDASEFAEKMTNQVEKEILMLKRKRIKSTEITDIILTILQKKTPASFLSFLAYREGDSRKNLKRLLNRYF